MRPSVDFLLTPSPLFLLVYLLNEHFKGEGGQKMTILAHFQNFIFD